MVAISRGRSLGVDVEWIHRDLDIDGIARRFFSAHEQRELATVDPVERRVAFFRCWTRKEAYLKAQGEGLALPLNEFDVSLAAGDTNALLGTRPDQTEASRWSIREIPAGAGYVAALFAAGLDWQLRSWSEARSRH
jgi:4'-phosphopantetheinyl transferase